MHPTNIQHPHTKFMYKLWNLCTYEALSNNLAYRTVYQSCITHEKVKVGKKSWMISTRLKDLYYFSKDIDPTMKTKNKCRG